jgi:hypothetical protein
MSYAFWHFMLTVMSKRFVLEDPSDEEFIEWLIRAAPHHLSDEEKTQQRECPNITAAQLLTHVVRTNRLKELREYRLYENTKRKFSEAAVTRATDLAARVRQMLAKP